MSDDKTQPEQHDEVWGTKARWGISLIAIGIVILMGCLWHYSPDLTTMILHARGFTDIEAKFLTNQAQWGDSFRATNALFSGIAMVAAITAVPPRMKPVSK